MTFSSRQRGFDSRNFTCVKSDETARCPHPPVLACILAAGESRRFGAENKLLSDHRGRPLMMHAVQTALALDVDPVLLVLGHEHEQVREAVEAEIHDPRLHFVLNENYREGKNTSIHAALDHRPADAPGLMVFLGDMPSIPIALARAVLEAFRKDPRITFPWIGGRKGFPTIWPASSFTMLRQAQGDKNFGAWLQQHREECTHVPWDEGSALEDIDLP